MLRGSGEGLKLVAAEREEHALRRLPERRNRRFDIFHLDPIVARDLPPGRTPESDELHAGARGRARRIGGDRRGVRVRGVDQDIDFFLAEIAGEPLGAAEAAASHRGGLRQRLGGAAGERHRHGEVRARAKRLSQSARLDGAAKNEDFHGTR